MEFKTYVIDEGGDRRYELRLTKEEQATVRTRIGISGFPEHNYPISNKLMWLAYATQVLERDRRDEQKL
jgi:hypothetical protein